MREGYLLDTNVASWAWDGRHRHHALARQRLAAIPEDLVFISPITLAEVEYGLAIRSQMDGARKRAIRGALASYQVLPINRHTCEPYANIKAALFEKFAPRDKRNKYRSPYVEDLIDRTTEKTLGIQENDLWIVATVMQYDLRFVTGDRRGGMLHILEMGAYIDRTEFWVPPV